MNKKVLLLAIGMPLLTAVFGNSFIPSDALVWYESLNHPWYKLPLWGSLIVALLIYVGYSIVLYRAGNKNLQTAVFFAAAALVGNELWNLAFFGTRNLTLTFWATLIFAALVLVQARTVQQHDRVAFRISFAYFLWVLLYDVPWLYQLSLMNV